MASTASATLPTVSSGDLLDLISSSASTTVYPSDDTILAVLQARFRADLPYTSLGSSNLVVINPLKVLANINDVSAKEYEERCYKDTSVPTAGSPRALQPHPYELAAKVYLLMKQRNESQAVVFRYVHLLAPSVKFLCHSKSPIFAAYFFLYWVTGIPVYHLLWCSSFSLAVVDWQCSNETAECSFQHELK